MTEALNEYNKGGLSVYETLKAVPLEIFINVIITYRWVNRRKM